MTSPKAKFERPPFRLANIRQLKDRDKKLLRAIKDDDSFISDITFMANNYADIAKKLRESLPLGDARRTFVVLQNNAYKLAEQLDNLPEDVESGLWRLREQWRPLGIEIKGDDISLSILLRDLADEISRVISDDLVDGKPGRKRASLEHDVAESLRECFKKHSLRKSRTSNAIIDSLNIIFVFGNYHLSRDALLIYLKKDTRKGKKSP